MQTASELIIEMECTFLLYCENIIVMHIYIRTSMCSNFFKEKKYHENIACIFLREKKQQKIKFILTAKTNAICSTMVKVGRMVFSF